MQIKKDIPSSSSISRHIGAANETEENPVVKDQDELIDHLFYEFRLFDSNKLDSIKNVDDILSGLNSDEIPFFAIHNSRFPCELINFLISDAKELINNIIMTSILHIIALITSERKSYKELASPEFINILLEIIKYSGQDKNCVYSWWIIMNLSNIEEYDLFNDNGVFNYINEISSSDLIANDKISFIISKIMKRFGNCFINNIPLYHEIVMKLLKFQVVPFINITLMSISKFFLNVSEEHLDLQLQILSNVASLFDLEDNTVIGRALSVFYSVFQASNDYIIVHFDEINLFEKFQHVLKIDNGEIQASGCELLIKLIASNNIFEKKILDSDIIETICQNAKCCSFYCVEQSIKIICEFICCLHNSDLLKRILENGGIELICQNISNCSDENMNSISDSIYHIMNQNPQLLKCMVDCGLIEGIEEIINSTYEDENIYNAANSLYEFLIPYLSDQS